MALTTYFLFFCMISQITKLAHCANDEGSGDVIRQIGINQTATITTGNYPNNVNSLISVFINQSSRGFFNTSSGEGADRAYGLYLCRGDLSAEKCSDCLQEVRQYVTEKSNGLFSNGFVYNTEVKCFVHYSNSSTSLVYRENSTLTGAGYGDTMSDNPAQYGQYNQQLSYQLDDLSRRVGDGNSSTPNFLTRVTYLGGKRALDVLVQCTPDISSTNCSSCVRNLYSTFTPTKVGGYALGTNCLLKYDTQDFIESGNPASFMPSYFQVMLVLLGTAYLTFM